MRIARDRLIFLALATCAEQVELAHAGAPAPTNGVRLALAVLHDLSGGDRAPFDAFWLQMREDERHSWSDTISAYCRSTHLMTQLRSVMRAVGVEPSVATEQPLHDAALRVYPRNRIQESKI
jgi:hypothetical protein